MNYSLSLDCIKDLRPKMQDANMFVNVYYYKHVIGF